MQRSFTNVKQHTPTFKPFCFAHCSQIQIGKTIISSSSLGVDIPVLNVEKNAAECSDVRSALSKLKSIKQFGLTVSKKAGYTPPPKRNVYAGESSRRKRTAAIYVDVADDDDDDDDDSVQDNDYVPDAQDDSDDLDKDWEDDEFGKDNAAKEQKTASGPKRTDLKETRLQSSPVFLCRKCRTQFDTLTALKEHVNKTEPCVDLNLICNKCQRVCDSMLEKRQHMRTHIVREKYVCDMCGKEYLHMNSLENHKTLVHGESFKADETQKFRCRDCPELFPNRVDLLAHAKQHDKEETWLCDICGKCFTNRHNMTNHRRIHQHIRPHQCKMCPKNYRTSILLRQHMHVHTGIKEYVCDVCAKQFAKLQSLRHHYRKEHDRDWSATHGVRAAKMAKAAITPATANTSSSTIDDTHNIDAAAVNAVPSDAPQIYDKSIDEPMHAIDETIDPC